MKRQTNAKRARRLRIELAREEAELTLGPRSSSWEKLLSGFKTAATGTDGISIDGSGSDVTEIKFKEDCVGSKSVRVSKEEVVDSVFTGNEEVFVNSKEDCSDPGIA